MIDSAQLNRLMTQTGMRSVLRPYYGHDDLLKLAQAIYCTALEDAADKVASEGMHKLSKIIRAMGNACPERIEEK